MKPQKTHSQFQIECFSPTLGRFIPRFKDAVHATLDGAKKVVDGFKACKWQIVGFNTQHQQWQVVKSGKPEAA